MPHTEACTGGSQGPRERASPAEAGEAAPTTRQPAAESKVVKQKCAGMTGSSAGGSLRVCAEVVGEEADEAGRGLM